MDKEDFNSLLGLYVNYWLIVLVKQGNITLKIGFDVFTLRENYVSILSKDLFCECVNMEKGSQILVFATEEDFFNKANYGLPSEFYHFVNLKPFISLNEEEAQHYNDFILNYDNIIKNNFLYKQKMFANLLNNVILVSFELWQKKLQKDETSKIDNELTELCRNFYNLVMQDCKQYHNVEHYADKLGVSRNYLTKIVKEITKQSPKEVIQKQLINETKNLLLNTDKTIKEITEELGFKDSSYLCRFFKNKTKENLTSFRQN